MRHAAFGALLGTMLFTASLGAQQSQAPGTPPSNSPLTIDNAVRLALQNYPAVQEQRARERAAAAGVSVARTAYLPRVDALWQENRATHNNVFGLLLPQSVVPSVSGPVLPSTSESVWGSAAGALVSWDAVDFGVRKASMQAARAQDVAASARVAETELDVAAAAADTFLTVLAADAQARAAQANVDRWQVFVDSVRALVGNQLRPGADQSRAEAELAQARNRVIQAQQAADVARATLAATIGLPSAPVVVMPGRLAELPPATTIAGAVDMHPAARAALADADAARAREKVVERSVFPRIALQSAASARGSGAVVPGVDSTSDGAWPRVSNWAAGVSVVFPAMDLFAVKPRERVEAQTVLAEQARYQRTLVDLTAQQLRSAAVFKAATAVAQNMPAVLSAAQETEQRARTRYSNALATVTEVAEAQHLLTEAESDDAVARLGVWRALLAEAQATGDLTPFLAQVRTP